MKKIFSSYYSGGAVNAGMLVLRLGLGILMIHHGFNKLSHFNDTARNMPNILGLGGDVNASLVIFAEFFCSMFLIIGLFTRLACIPLIITMGVAIVKAHHSNVFGEGELPALYLAGFITLLFIGPGRVSVDAMIGK